MKADQEIARIANYLKLRGFNYIRFARAPIATPLAAPEPVMTPPVIPPPVAPALRDEMPSEKVPPVARIAPATAAARLPAATETARPGPSGSRRFRLLSDVRQTDLSAQDNAPESSSGATRLLRDINANPARSATPEADALPIRRGRPLSPKMFS